MGLALNNLKRLICHKIQTNKLHSCQFETSVDNPLVIIPVNVKLYDIVIVLFTSSFYMPQNMLY